MNFFQIENDAIIAGLFLILLAGLFFSAASNHAYWKKLYGIVPPLLFCYLIPGFLNSYHIIHGESSGLYGFATKYLLPASLILLLSTANLKAILGLGNKALLIFFTGTLGIIVGGPISLFIVSLFSDSFHMAAQEGGYWKGLVTITGSWIGGSSSQLALKEIYGCSEELFVIILVIDALVANMWTALLFYGAGITQKIDTWLGADASLIEDVKKSILSYQETKDKPADLKDLSLILGVGFGGTAVAHAGSGLIVKLFAPHRDWLMAHGLEPFASQFLWLILLSTTIGILLSFTQVRKMEKLGSTDFATLFIYFLIMTIGMRLDLFHIGANVGLLVVAIIWMLIHILTMFTAAKISKAPFFFVAVGSQANIGGVATAPAVAAAFHPSLAPVGVLLAVLSHVVGTYAGIISAWLMQWVG
ncbi:MAG: hypothetical protein RI903_854 [Bacteroidota bacterium]